MKVSGEFHTPGVLILWQMHPMTLNRKLGGSSNGVDAKEKTKSVHTISSKGIDSCEIYI
jgi:hypothetical protein